jgi:hypothetical protein
MNSERHDVRSAQKDRAESKKATTISEHRSRKTMKQQPKTAAKQSTIWPNTNFQPSWPLAPAPKVALRQRKTRSNPLKQHECHISVHRSWQNNNPYIPSGSNLQQVVAIGRTMFAKSRIEAVSKTRIVLQRRKSPSKT